MKNIGLLFLVGLLVSSCVSQIPQNSIRVYDEKAYVLVRPLLRFDFTKQKIRTEILPSASNFDPLGGILGHKVAKKLYETLSISFRFPESDFNKQALLLKDYITSDAIVNMYSYGFTVKQGLELLTVTVLGEVDWDRDNVNDYLVSFRIKQEPQTYKSENRQLPMKGAVKLPVGVPVELPSREYILLIKNVNSNIYDAQILFIHDYIKGSTGVFSKIYKDHIGAQDSLFQDHGAVSFEQGQEQIVFAPNRGKKEETKESQKGRENEEIKQTKLSE